MVVLWQLAYSHFNEKARWALDYKGIAHERRDLLPGFHIPRTLWMTRQKQLPVLEIDGHRICDSTAIIARLEDDFPDAPALYPGDRGARARALELEELFDEQLGPHIRRAWFEQLLRHPDYAATAITAAEPERTRRRYRRWFRVLAFAMRRDMKISARRAAESWEITASLLDRIAAEIGDSGYLAGDGFSVADLTACSLMAPVLPPPACPLAPELEMPDELEGFRERVAEHPAVRWAAGIIARHRRGDR